MGTIDIYGIAERRVNFDIAVMEITFKESGNSSSSVSKHVMHGCEMFLEELEELGINPAKISLEDDTIEECGYRNNDTISAERSLKLRIPFRMDLINRIRMLLEKKQYSVTIDLDYELSNESEIRDELLKEAMLDSKRRAELLADSLGMKIIGIESAETNERPTGNIVWEIDDDEDMLMNLPPKAMKSDMLLAREETLSMSTKVKWIIQ